MIPDYIPVMTEPAVEVGALAWYPYDTPSLTKMSFEARDEEVPLLYQTAHKPGMVGVPRFLAPAPYGPSNKLALGQQLPMMHTGTLRKEQVPFVMAAKTYLKNFNGFLGQAPTGFGKTVAACAILAAVGRTSCVVVPKSDLDWDSELVRHTNMPKDRIDFWNGQKLPDPEAWVVIASLQSIYREGYYPSEVYRRFGLVLFDEVHRLGAPEFSAAIRQFPAKYRFGLSADPERRDGKMPLIQAHLGWPIVKGTTDAEQPDYFVVKTGWSEPYFNGKRWTFDPKKSGPAEKSLIADPVRNASIGAAVYRAHKAGRRSIVFVKQKVHGEYIMTTLKSMGADITRVMPYNGASTVAEKERARHCPPGMVLVATYKYAAEGTNIPPLDTAFIAHPIYDPRQPVGRITRKLDGKPTPVVVDFVDTGSPTLLNLARARWRYLKGLGARYRGDFR